MHAKEAEAFGVNVGDVSFDLGKAMAWKEDVIKSLRDGIAFMLKKFKVEVIKGEAKLLGPGKVQVDDTVYEGENVVVGTGSVPLVPPIPGRSGACIYQP